MVGTGADGAGADGAGAGATFPVLVFEVAFAFVLGSTAPPPHPDKTHADNTEADASINGKYRVRGDASGHPRAVLVNSLAIKNASSRNCILHDELVMRVANSPSRSNDRRSVGTSQLSLITYMGLGGLAHPQ